jgi:hypothetical protein
VVVTTTLCTSSASETSALQRLVTQTSRLVPVPMRMCALMQCGDALLVRGRVDAGHLDVARRVPVCVAFDADLPRPILLADRDDGIREQAVRCWRRAPAAARPGRGRPRRRHS